MPQQYSGTSVQFHFNYNASFNFEPLNIVELTIFNLNVPLYQYKNKGDIDSSNNYRGITLTNVLAKIFSHILLNRINIWSEKTRKNKL